MTPMNELRVVVIYRADLPEMTRAKGEVQFGHAIAGVFTRCDMETLHLYLDSPQTKISMEVDDEAAFLKIINKATSRAVPYYVVTDAGRTVFDGPTVTCIGVGPMSKTDSNAICRGARMRA